MGATNANSARWAVPSCKTATPSSTKPQADSNTTKRRMSLSSPRMWSGPSVCPTATLKERNRSTTYPRLKQLLKTMCINTSLMIWLTEVISTLKRWHSVSWHKSSWLSLIRLSICSRLVNFNAYMRSFKVWSPHTQSVKARSMMLLIALGTRLVRLKTKFMKVCWKWINGSESTALVRRVTGFQSRLVTSP